MFVKIKGTGNFKQKNVTFIANRYSIKRKEDLFENPKTIPFVNDAA